MKNFILLFFIIVFSTSYSQGCVYSNLSKSYSFSASFRDSFVTLTIHNNKTGKKQVITFQAEFLIDEFADCNAVRSYTTGYNKNALVADNDYGSLIVADFNFDGREDIAIKNDSGGNGGPLYNYYLQNAKGNFVINDFLTNTVQFFPSDINAVNKQLITIVHANTMQLSEITYKLNTANGQWKEINQRFINYKE